MINGQLFFSKYLLIFCRSLRRNVSFPFLSLIPFRFPLLSTFCVSDFSNDYDELSTIDPNSIEYADYVSRTLSYMTLMSEVMAIVNGQPLTYDREGTALIL